MLYGVDEKEKESRSIHFDLKLWARVSQLAQRDHTTIKSKLHELVQAAVELDERGELGWFGADLRARVEALERMLGKGPKPPKKGIGRG